MFGAIGYNYKSKLVVYTDTVKTAEYTRNIEDAKFPEYFALVEN